LEKLIEILRKSELDRFPVGLGQAIDAPSYTFKFYYNNKVKTSKGYPVPYFNRSLLSYLLRIYQELNLEECKEDYRFDE
jgi:hypothetical protein